MSVNRERNAKSHGKQQKSSRNVPKSSAPLLDRGEQGEKAHVWTPNLGGKRPASPRKESSHSGKIAEDGLIWGVHPCLAALENPNRENMTLYCTEARFEALSPHQKNRTGLKVNILEAAELARRLPSGAVHQGIAIKAPFFEDIALDDLIEESGILIMLDQVTDPQNIGAILRSAAAFGAKGLVLQDRHCPPLQGALAKTAAGALETVAVARVINLSRALEKLAREGWTSIGLAGESPTSLSEVSALLKSATPQRKWVIVMGSEGDGLRRLVAEHCDHLARIPMPGGFESLNVSHALSIVLYELSAREG